MLASETHQDLQGETLADVSFRSSHSACRRKHWWLPSLKLPWTRKMMLWKKIFLSTTGDFYGFLVSMLVFREFLVCLFRKTPMGLKIPSGLENSDANSGCALAKGEGSILYAHLCILKHNAPWHPKFRTRKPLKSTPNTFEVLQQEGNVESNLISLMDDSI